MARNTVKGYFLTILFGLLLLAAVIFLALQWGVRSEFSLYGKPVRDVPTIWIMLCCVVAGPILLLVCRLFFRGVWILWKSRRAEAQQQREILKEAGKIMGDQPSPPEGGQQ